MQTGATTNIIFDLFEVVTLCIGTLEPDEFILHLAHTFLTTCGGETSGSL